MIRQAAIICTLLPQLAAAQELSFPGNAELTLNDSVDVGDFILPTGRWTDGELPGIRVEGALTRQVWQIDAAGLETLQLLRSLRDQLRRADYDIALECDTSGCGGFDFRFALDVVAPPVMQVNLADFRYLSARKGDDDAVGILISRAGDAIFAQVTQVGAQSAPVADAAPMLASLPATGSTDLAGDLTRDGRAVLAGVTFTSGSTTPAAGPIAALQALADMMAARPDLTVAIVGHTDASGGLEGNIAISRRRAAAVVERLVAEYDVPRARLSAEGMGYLAPLTSNATPEGREANRRVEAIVTSTLP